MCIKHTHTQFILDRKFSFIWRKYNTQFWSESSIFWQHTIISYKWILFVAKNKVSLLCSLQTIYPFFNQYLYWIQCVICVCVCSWNIEVRFFGILSKLKWKENTTPKKWWEKKKSKTMNTDNKLVFILYF